MPRALARPDTTLPSEPGAGYRWGVEVLSGADLDPYKVPAVSACWWCGSPGPLTREHKFKKSDLSRMWDLSGGLVWGDDVRQREVKSVRKTQDVRFEPSLCARCNNERSQPFDEAYRSFSEYVWDRPELRRARYIDMASIYGTDWSMRVLDLARYVAKHIGCRLAHERYPIPSSLKLFLDGAPTMPDVHMVLFKSRDHYELYTKGVRDGVEARGLWISPSLGGVSPSRQQLTLYSSALIVNFIGIFYRWEDGCQSTDPFYVYRRARLHWRHKLPVA